ncbi:MAG: peptidoglycan-binding protein [Rhodobacteraceae bacterium]|nr:peptidoglycan-binding protein [Paracoccaceae bacterium]
MRQVLVLAAVVWALAFGRAALAQEAWVQVEALPSLAEAEARAGAWGGTFPNVAGFRLSSGWYAIVLGPFERAEAARQLELLRSERLIPQDSYIADTGAFRQRFWPAAGAAGAAAAGTGDTPLAGAASGGAAAAPAADGAAEGAAEGAAAAAAPGAGAEPEQTPREARAAEAALTEEERREVQAALQWEGVYAGAIDGAFGPGTRKSMAAWQAAQGFEETGVLTSRQRAALLDRYRAEQAALGLKTVSEKEAGIEIVLPTALVGPARYDPPFVHFDPRDGSGFRVLLISQQGDAATLAGLYDIMQSLEIVPLEGERRLGPDSFVLNGANGTVQSYTQAELSGGLIKGFTLAWPPAEADRAARVLEAMKASFRAVGDRALDDSLGQPLSEDREGLLAGLEVRRPVLSRSGFYADPAGAVVTVAEAVRGCRRVTLDLGTEADVAAVDPGLGVALLRPRAALAPRVVAELESAAPRRGSDIAVAGYSYEDRLDAPVVTFGTLEEMQGLNGEPMLARITAGTLAGDAGGPVLDASGAVLGMLLPRADGGGRILPPGEQAVLDAGALGAFLSANGVTPAASARTGSMPAEDMAATARAMTVLVSCWN